MDRDRIQGMGKQVKGEVKDTLGKMTGNKQQQIEGKIDKGVGKVQDAYGRAKDDVREHLDASQRRGDNAKDKMRDPRPDIKQPEL